MEIRKRTITKDMLRHLEGLAYWIADLNYIKERFGPEEPELETCRKTISLIFDELDRIQTPFSVQNNIICYFEEWRHYKMTSTRDFLRSQNVEIID